MSSTPQWYMPSRSAGRSGTEQDVCNAIRAGSADATTLVLRGRHGGLDSPPRRPEVPASPPAAPPAAGGARLHRAPGPRAHEIDYRIEGGGPAVRRGGKPPNPRKSPRPVAEAGALMYYGRRSSGDDFRRRSGQAQAKGLMGAPRGRQAHPAGESLFIDRSSRPGRLAREVAFAAPYPGASSPWT